MNSFDAVACRVAQIYGVCVDDVKRAAVMAARGADYSGLSKFLPRTDISVRIISFPEGLKFLTSTDISVCCGFDRSVHSRSSKGVSRARSNGLSRKVVKS